MQSEIFKTIKLLSLLTTPSPLKSFDRTWHSNKALSLWRGYDRGVIKVGTKKPPRSEQGGFFGDQSQVFPCFHCGGSQLFTNQT